MIRMWSGINHDYFSPGDPIQVTEHIAQCTEHKQKSLSIEKLTDKFIKIELQF